MANDSGGSADQTTWVLTGPDGKVKREEGTGTS